MADDLDDLDYDEPQYLEDDFDEDCYVDDDWPVKEEPDCYACSDFGCSACEPTRFQAWRWRTRYRIADWWRARRHARHAPPPDDPWGAPF